MKSRVLTTVLFPPQELIIGWHVLISGKQRTLHFFHQFVKKKDIILQRSKSNTMDMHVKFIDSSFVLNNQPHAGSHSA